MLLAKSIVAQKSVTEKILIVRLKKERDVLAFDTTSEEDKQVAATVKFLGPVVMT